MENNFALILTLMQWPIFITSILILAYSTLRNRRKISSGNAEKFFENFRIGGHRGSPTKCPENTIASMEQAHSEGADFIEFDVSLTKDGVAVILHDDTLDRTTNLTGLIREFLHKDLLNCDCGAKFVHESKSDSELLKAHAMPSPDEMVEWAKAHGMKMIFDLRDGDDILLKKLGQLFQEHNLYHLGIVCSFKPKIVYKIKRQHPEILTGITWRKWEFSYKDIAATTPRSDSIFMHYITMVYDVINTWSIRTALLPLFLGVDLVLTERSEISEGFIRQQMDRGLKVCAWTVNDANEMMWMYNILKIPFLTDKPFLAKPLIDYAKDCQN